MTRKHDSRRGFFLHIALPSALAVLLFVGTLFLIVIPSFETAMMDRKREMIMELTHAATSILDKYHRDETEGLLTREEAQQTAISRIQYLRYGEENKDYFWITDMHPVMIMHPYRPELNGQDLTEYKDPHGKQLFVESVKIAAEQGYGYVDYMWQWKDDSTHIVSKLSFVKAFEPWGWIIGTGIYIEDVKSEIANLSRKFVTISIIISLFTALILFYVGRQSLRIENKKLRAEEDLSESREKYRSLVEASTEGLLMVIDGKVSFVNTILQRMTGFAEPDLIGRSPVHVVDLPEETLSNLAEPGHDITAKAFETGLHTSTGDTLAVLANISPVTFYGREAVILSIKDLTVDEEAREELFRSKEQFKALMDKLSVGVFRTTVDLRGRFLEANSAALEILGYKSMDELSDSYILEMFVDIEDKRGFRQELLDNGFIKNQVLKLRRKNGQMAIVNCSLALVGEKGPAQFCDGIIEDISYKKRETPSSDNLLGEYNRFAQLFYQPVRDLVQPAPSVKYYEPADVAVRKMVAAGSDAIIVYGENGELLGLITDRGIREKLLAGGHTGTMKAFEIMRSPVIKAFENTTLVEAISILRKDDSGHIVIVAADDSFRGLLSSSVFSKLLNTFPAVSSLAVGQAEGPEMLRRHREAFISSLLPLIEHSGNPEAIFHSLAVLSDDITNRIIELVTEEIGNPPAGFCFVSLGSDARKEQSLSTDQDNAIIYADVDEDMAENAKAYFRLFGEKVCTALNEAGYRFCKGNIMAMNPEWCQPLSVWKSYFTKWINKSSAKDLLDINIFFDIRPIHGDKSLVQELTHHIFSLTSKNPAYLFHLTQNTLLLKPQVGFWGNILLETAGAPPETVNIKESIMPVVNFARIYALKNSIETPGTIDRLNLLLRNHQLREATWENTVQAFEYLNMMRLRHQAYLISNNLKPDNLINTKNLSELDKTIIKKVISNINNMLAKLSYDFKGSY